MHHLTKYYPLLCNIKLLCSWNTFQSSKFLKVFRFQILGKSEVIKTPPLSLPFSHTEQWKTVFKKNNKEKNIFFLTCGYKSLFTLINLNRRCISCQLSTILKVSQLEAGLIHMWLRRGRWWGRGTFWFRPCVRC